MKFLKSFISTCFFMVLFQSMSAQKPVRVGVVGLVHTHVHWILGREDRGDIVIVGIVEPNRDLAQQYSEMHGYSMDIVYDSIEEMVENTKPEAVTAFNMIIDHLQVVEYCAPRGIHVMVEKPLAVNYDHAKKMAALARQHDIKLLTNYETSWYCSNYDAYELIHQQDSIGSIKRIEFNTGHPGPIEIGCNPEFLEWLTDPELNGGGALTDFGCYGANLSTWFLKGEKPRSVLCLTQQLKPELYPKVEDEAIILLEYNASNVIIKASWNWSHNRKDMVVYGQTGYVNNLDGQNMIIQTDEDRGSRKQIAKNLPEHVNDPFALLHAVIRNDYELTQFDVSGLENNLITMQILELAKISAEEGRKILWSEYFE